MSKIDKFCTKPLSIKGNLFNKILNKEKAMLYLTMEILTKESGKITVYKGMGDLSLIKT